MNARYAGDRTTGFASPASDSVEGPIDLSQTLDMTNPSRYPVHVRGAYLDHTWHSGWRYSDSRRQ